MALTKLPKNAIGTGAIDASKIEDGTIQNAELSGSLTGTQLASTLDLSSKTVTLPNTSVTSAQLAGSITNAKLSNSTITVRGTSRSLGDSFSIGVDVDWQSVITADGSTGTTGSAGLGYFINTTSAAHTFTLPASATRGDTIGIIDYAGTFATNKLTIARNGHNIQGVANNSLIGTNRASLVLVYVDSTKGWLFYEQNNAADLQLNVLISATGGTVSTSGDYKIHTFTGDGCFVVSAGGGPVANLDYLVIAGGGSSGIWNPGGGSGGYRTNFPSGCAGLLINPGTYPIIVGAGGVGRSDNCQSTGGKGSNSVFSTITSAGGGFGLTSGTDRNGGSGGGTGTGNSPPVSPPQGNPGGPQSGAFPNGGGAGGGGAGGAGQCGTPQAGGAGGPGATNSINASPVTRGGGGGGGVGFACSSFPQNTQPGGAGGPGGGGAGATKNGGTPLSGQSGSENTGGGGGSGYYGGVGFTPGKIGGNGGKGIIILRYKYQ